MDPSVLVAHRGYPARYPENTAAGFREALRLGASWVEADVQLTADRVPVLFHDRTLERVCGAPGTIGERSLAELAPIHAWEPGRFGDRFRDTPLATLEEFAELVSSSSGGRAFVEVKSVAVERFGVEEVVARTLERIAPGRFVLIAYDEAVLAEARRRHWPEVGLVLRLWEQVFDAAIAPDFLFCNENHLPQRQPLRRGNPRVAVFDVTDPEAAQALLARGVDLVETFAIGEMLEAARGGDG